MAYFTKQQMTQFGAAVLAEGGRATNFSNASLRLNEDAQRGQLPTVPPEPAPKPPVTLDIFLAHSSLDQVQVLGIYHFLKRRGYKVYLDKICDPQLDPALVTRATARVLRYRLSQCKSLIIATSVNTPEAKWVPWELGFSDGWNGKSAIMPILEAAGAVFQGREYFELCPEVRDAGPNYPYPRDLDIYDNGRFIGNWSDWVIRPRTF